jgi:hypothetical protein
MFLLENNPIKALETIIKLDSVPKNEYPYIYPLRKILKNILISQGKYYSEVNRIFPHLPQWVKNLIFNKIIPDYEEFKLEETQFLYDLAYNEVWIYDLSTKYISKDNWKIELDQILNNKRNVIIQRYQSITDYLNHLLTKVLQKKEFESFLFKASKEYLSSLELDFKTISNINLTYLIDLIDYTGKSIQFDGQAILLDLIQNLTEDFRLFIIKGYEDIIRKSLQVIRSYFPPDIVYNEENSRKYPKFKLYLEILNKVIISNKELGSYFIKELLGYGYIKIFKKEHLEIIIKNLKVIASHLLNIGRVDVLTSVLPQTSAIYPGKNIIQVLDLIQSRGGEFRQDAQEPGYVEELQMKYILAYHGKLFEMESLQDEETVYLIKNTKKDTNSLIEEKFQSLTQSPN